MSQIIDGYICKDGERVAFYDCDPSKNETCKKTSCGLLGRGVRQMRKDRKSVV